jgi:putative SOS response-associated peptidase YedK
LWTFTIVTTSANKEFSWLHDRQPVILSSKEDLDTWLDTSKETWTAQLTKLVEPYHDANAPLEWYEHVSFWC